MPGAIDRAVAAHAQRWGRSPSLVARAPGRVNLIGEHTDYNDGFTLPMALPFDTAIAFTDRRDAGESVHVWSEGFGEAIIDPAADPRSVEPWARHLAGVIAVLAGRGIAAGGWRATIATDIPTGASLSSSAAIEVAAITALLARAGMEWPAIEIALAGQRVENEFVGLPSGIMDQLISAGAVAGHASLMDCRALTLDPVALPDDVVVAVLDTGTRRVLADAAYADRRAACERVVATLGVRALRDVTLDRIEGLAGALVTPLDARRARHVVTENERTLSAADALRSGDAATFGRLMHASHVSLRDDYDVSGPGLDAIVDVAATSVGCLGARMTGGGFAGCAVALVEADAIDAFEHDVVGRYGFDGHRARVWACTAGPGASVV